MKEIINLPLPFLLPALVKTKKNCIFIDFFQIRGIKRSTLAKIGEKSVGFIKLKIYKLYIQSFKSVECIYQSRTW